MPMAHPGGAQMTCPHLFQHYPSAFSHRLVNMKPRLRAQILTSRFLPVLVFPVRLRTALLFSGRNSFLSFKWLLSSREFANYTYDLKPRNREHLAWFVSSVTGATIAEIKEYFSEIESDVEFQNYIKARLAMHRRGGEIDKNPFLGWRIGWYAIVRATKPKILVETGTEKGMGSLVLAKAAAKNDNQAIVYTLDIEPSSGLMIGPEYDGRVVRLIGDSVMNLSTLEKIDFFIHDSDHSAEHELAEFEAILPRLTNRAICLSDNSHVTTVLSKWSETHGRQFYFFKEEPLDHWYPGAGIGVSLPSAN